MDRMLYVPFATPPREMLLHAALYWDNLVTLAPANYSLQSAEAEQLRDAGILELADPERIFLRVSGPLKRLEREVERALESVPGSALTPDKRFADSAMSRLYAGKLPKLIEATLDQQGLLSRVSPWGRDTYFVNPAVLQVVLTVAGVETARILDHDGRRTSLHVDRRSIEQCAFAPTRSANMRCWRLDVSQCLFQVPITTPIEDVLTLRQTYNDERLELSVAIQRLVAGLSISGEEPDARILAKAVQTASDDYAKALRGNRMSIVRRGLYLLVGTGLAAVGEIPAHGMGAAMATTAVAGSLSAYGIDLAASKTRSDRNDGFAYVHRVRALKKSVR